MRIDWYGEYLPNQHQLGLLYKLHDILPDCRILVEIFNDSAAIKVTSMEDPSNWVKSIINVHEDESWDYMYDQVLTFFNIVEEERMLNEWQGRQKTVSSEES